MRIPLFIRIAALIFVLILCSSQKKYPLEGAWALVQAKYPAAEDSSKVKPSGKTVKLITKSYFICLNQGVDKKDAIISCGKYTFDGKHYTETLESFTQSRSTGQSYYYRSKIKGRKWELTGIHKTASDTSRSDFNCDEVWEKIE
jgi:hypothetical protein